MREATLDKDILYLVHSYHTFQKDSIELLAKNFRNVYVIVRYKPLAEISKIFPIKKLLNHRKSYVIQDSDKPDNVHIYTASVWYLPLKFFYRILGRQHFRVVDRIIKKHNISFDLIHAHFTWTSGYVAKRLKEKYGKPYVVTVHEDNNWFQEELKSGNEDLFSVWRNADQLIRVDRETIGELKEYNEDTVFLPNGFNKGLFEPRDKEDSRKELGLDLEKKILLNVGGLEEYKGQIYLIRAMNILVNELGYEDLELYVIGEGSLGRKLEREIDKFNLNEQIKLLGSKLHKEVPIWFNACDIFVLPSLAESFGIVQLEAFASGKPVVATKNEGSKNIVISDNYGLLCEIGDPEDLAQSIDKALKKEWDKQKIIDYTKDYTWEKVSEKSQSIYEKVLNL